MNPLKTNLLNLAAQAAHGMLDDENHLRNQIMRLWRGVDFDPVQGHTLALTPDTAKPARRTKQEA